MDETICPVDFDRAGMITDDTIFNLIVAPLPSGCRLTAVMDCCHSGTGMDLPLICQVRLRGSLWERASLSDGSVTILVKHGLGESGAREAKRPWGARRKVVESERSQFTCSHTRRLRL
jgi:hypothetical protein